MKCTKTEEFGGSKKIHAGRQETDADVMRKWLQSSTKKRDQNGQTGERRERGKKVNGGLDALQDEFG